MFNYTDKEIIERIKKGSDEAFEYVFLKFYDRFCAYAASLIKNDNGAEEIVQDVFYEFWKKREKINISTSDRLSPKDIFNIATGRVKGDKNAALKAFTDMAIVLCDALTNTITLIDGLIVIGGGLSAAYELLSETIVNEMNGKIETYEGKTIPRLVQKTFDLHDKTQLKLFLSGDKKEISVPGGKKKLIYDPEKRVAIGLSRLGTSSAIHLGAYAFALKELDK